MATVMAQQQKWLLRKFHTLCTQLNMSKDDKLTLLGSYGVESSKDLSNYDLMEVCTLLENSINPATQRIVKLRKRVIAAIGGYLRLIGKNDQDINYIKGIACRATKYEYFNKIPVERLDNLYNAFVKKQRDAKAVDEICNDIMVEALTSSVSLN